MNTPHRDPSYSELERLRVENAEMREKLREKECCGPLPMLPFKSKCPACGVVDSAYREFVSDSAGGYWSCVCTAPSMREKCKCTWKELTHYDTLEKIGVSIVASGGSQISNVSIGNGIDAEARKISDAVTATVTAAAARESKAIFENKIGTFATIVLVMSFLFLLQIFGLSDFGFLRMGAR